MQDKKNRLFLVSAETSTKVDLKGTDSTQRFTPYYLPVGPKPSTHLILLPCKNVIAVQR